MDSWPDDDDDDDDDSFPCGEMTVQVDPTKIIVNLVVVEVLMLRNLMTLILIMWKVNTNTRSVRNPTHIHFPYYQCDSSADVSPILTSRSLLFGIVVFHVCRRAGPPLRMQRPWLYAWSSTLESYSGTYHTRMMMMMMMSNHIVS